MTYATRIVTALGGTREAARMLGIPPSTVQSWKTAGTIPAKYHKEIMRAAKQARAPITIDDFFK